jgi:hypothetical protein
MGIRDHMRGWLDRHPVFAVVGALAMLGTDLAWDFSRLSRAYQVMGPAIQRPLVLGLAFAVGTAAWLGWLVRRWADFPRAARSFWKGMLTVWVSVSLLAFVVTHKRYPMPATELAVIVIAYLAGIVAGGVAAAPFAAWRRRRDHLPREHRPDDVVEVWHVRDRSRGATYGPYFLAYCECGWASEAREETDPEAEPTVFTDACRHGSKVSRRRVSVGLIEA